MGLSKREKVLLVILMLVIVFYLYFNYLYAPKYEELLTLRAEFEESMVLEKKTEKALKDSEVIEQILQNLKIKYNQLEETLPSVIHQEEIIVILKGIMDENSISLKTVGYSMEEKETTSTEDNFSVMEMIDNYEKVLEGKSTIDITNYFKPGNQSNGEETEQTAGEDVEKQSLKYLDVNISFSGTYDNLKGALIDMEQSTRKIIVKSLSLAGTEDELVGNLSIAFPYYPLDGSKKAIDWPYSDIYGNTQPFSIPYDYISQVAKEKENVVSFDNEDKKTNISAESDFYIILKPFISDMPTVYVGKYPYRYSEIYAKNVGPEKVVISVQEENDKFYYRYENSMDSYPRGNDTWEEFTSFKDNLILSILSMPRLNTNDLSGVILEINNSTRKQLDVKIYNDDPNNPRVKIENQNGLINIENLES